MSAGAANDELQKYLRESAGWDVERMRVMQRSERRAWTVAVTACGCACLGSLALALLMPLKRVDPFLIRVDSSTGVVDVVPIYAGTARMDEAVTRYFLTHYVTECERFNFSTAEADYEQCGSFHSAQRNQAWYALWSSSNPSSPLNLHKDGSTVAVQVESISFIKRSGGAVDLAQVRYLKLERPAGGTQARLSHWIATIQYTYAPPPSDPVLRRWNPLGFRIVDFVSEPEVLRDVPAAGTTGAAP